MPTLLEWAMIPAMVQRSVGWYSASWNGKPSTTIWSGTVYALIGVWPPCSNAAAAVITLAVLPGSNTSLTGRSAVSARLSGCAGLNDGACAMARICPVCGSITTTVQLLASVSLIRCAQACSASHCRLARMVSRTLRPGTMDRLVCPATGMGSPLLPFCTS